MRADDPVLAEVAAAVTAARADDTDGARNALLALWERIGPGADPVHRCILAHYLADLFDDPAEALAWDVRALDAAEASAPAEEVLGSYPSLHLNLADGYRRLGAMDAARAHVRSAGEHLGVLADDPYGDLVRSAVPKVAAAIERGETGPLPRPT